MIKGSHHSEETKEKLRNTLRGRIAPNKGGTSWAKGRHFSEGHRKNISNGLKGKHLSDEHKQRISQTLKGRPLLEETKKKMREAKIGHPSTANLKGKDNPAWNGGSSFLPYSPDWTDELKQFIKDRDNNECQNPYCDERESELDVHHINYDKMNCNQFNLITLCHSCNSKANYNRKEWKRFYKRIIWGKYL